MLQTCQLTLQTVKGGQCTVLSTTGGDLVSSLTLSIMIIR